MAIGIEPWSRGSERIFASQCGRLSPAELEARIAREILPKLEALEVQLRRPWNSIPVKFAAVAPFRLPPGYTDAVNHTKLSKGR